MTKTLILHVDDNEAHRYTVAKTLSMAGYAVEQASTGNAALDLARKKPSLIILDVNLPDLHGFVVARRLKSDPSTSSIPILHLSASRVLTKDRTTGLESGADAYLTEPVDSGEFLATVKALLRMRESEEKASAMAREWEATFNAIKDAVCVTTPSGIITRCNRALNRLVNHPIEDLVGQSLWELLEKSFAQNVEQIASLKIPPTSVHYTKQIELAEKCFSVSADLVVSYPEDESYTVLTFSDVTSAEASKMERKTLIDKLSRSNAELGVFAQVASHDLKEPLRVISLYVQLIQRKLGERFNDDLDQYLEHIVTGTSRMSSMIDSLLAFSKVDHDTPNASKTNLNDIFGIACENLQEAIRSAEVEIRKDSLPVVIGDPVQLTQLLQNLIGNAIKFRGQERPFVHISAKPGKSEWVISVRDNGIGIPKHEQENVFQLFKRVHGETYTGNGIGLAICKKIIERRGGNIWLESIAGEGTTFFFTIPHEPV